MAELTKKKFGLKVERWVEANKDKRLGPSRAVFYDLLSALERMKDMLSLESVNEEIDNMKFGHALPTLESVQAAYEAKEDEDEDDKVRAGVRSAAEKLGMKPSHVKEDTNLAEGEELDVIETDNRDSKYTILRLSNGDYVEVNVIELYQNLIDNQSDDV